MWRLKRGFITPTFDLGFIYHTLWLLGSAFLDYLPFPCIWSLLFPPSLPEAFSLSLFYRSECPNGKAGQQDIFYQVHVEKEGTKVFRTAGFFVWEICCVNKSIFSQMFQLIFRSTNCMHVDIDGYTHELYVIYIHTNMFEHMFSVLYRNTINLSTDTHKQKPILNSLKPFSLDRTRSWKKACEQQYKLKEGWGVVKLER